MCAELSKRKSTSVVSFVVFFATLAVVIPGIVSVIFPALIITLTSPMGLGDVDPFEIGGLALPFLSISTFLFSFGLLYYSGHLPNSVQRKIRFILNFEVSKRISLLVLLILLMIFVGLNLKELPEQEIWIDFKSVKGGLDIWPIDDKTGEFNMRLDPVRFFLLKSSEEIFQNIRIVPFLASISLLILTYLFSVEIFKKRFSGLISVTILLHSYIFLTFSSAAAYTNFWTLFYLLSLYLIIKKWQFSILSYLTSVFSKLLTITFLPSTLFFIYCVEIPRKQKIYNFISYGLVAVIGLIIYLNLFDFPFKYSNFDRFLYGFAVLGYQFRFDQFFIVFLVPLVWGLFMLSRNGNKPADAILFLMFVTLLSAPLTSLAGVSIHAYRLIPFIVFFSIGVGALFSQRLTMPEDKNLSNNY